MRNRELSCPESRLSHGLYPRCVSLQAPFSCCVEGQGTRLPPHWHCACALHQNTKGQKLHQQALDVACVRGTAAYLQQAVPRRQVRVCLEDWHPRLAPHLPRLCARNQNVRHPADHHSGEQHVSGET